MIREGHITAFFDAPTDDELSPEVRQLLEEHRRLLGRESTSVVWKVMGRVPKIVEARWKATIIYRRFRLAFGNLRRDTMVEDSIARGDLEVFRGDFSMGA